MADTLRYANMILGVMVIALFPMTAYMQGRRWSAWFAIAGSELIYLAVVLGSLANLGEPLNVRLPLVTASGLLYVAFIASVALPRMRARRRPS